MLRALCLLALLLSASAALLPQTTEALTPPQFVQEAETSTWDTPDSPKATASFNVLAGDVLLAFAICKALLILTQVA